VTKINGGAVNFKEPNSSLYLAKRVTSFRYLSPR